MICPQCRSGDCLRSHRKGVADFFATLIGLRPWRCGACDLRFYAWTVAIPFARYVHCPRCGNFDLEHVARERVDRGTLITVKRFLGFSGLSLRPMSPEVLQHVVVSANRSFHDFCLLSQRLRLLIAQQHGNFCASFDKPVR